jgi:predicted PurR-regulated permease PerM
VAIPIVVSLLISYALEPITARIVSCHVPRAVAVPFVLLGLLALMGAGIYGLRGEAAAFASRLPDGAHAIAQAVRTKAAKPSGPFAKMQQAVKELETAATSGRQPKAIDGVQPVRIEEPTFKWNAWIWQGSHGAVALAAQLIVVICLTYYLMIAGDSFKRKLVRIVGPSMSEKKLTVQILEEIDRQIGRFLLARAAISAIVGVAVWATFRLLDLDQAAVFGVLSGILFTVPLIGPAILIAGAFLAGILQTGSIGMAAAAAGICTAIAAVEGNLLAPWLMSRAGRMSPVAVFVSLLFWGWLWGVWGLLLAVPITAAIKAVCERVDDLDPFAELLAP